MANRLSQFGWFLSGRALSFAVIMAGVMTFRLAEAIFVPAPVVANGGATVVVMLR
jgi:hypothetical protein